MKYLSMVFLLVLSPTVCFAGEYLIIVDGKNVASYTIPEMPEYQVVLSLTKGKDSAGSLSYDFAIMEADLKGTITDSVGIFTVTVSFPLKAVKYFTYPQQLKHPVSISFWQNDLKFDIAAYQGSFGGEVQSKVVEVSYSDVTKKWTTALLTQ